MLVSIIIPVYNDPRLELCLEALSHQNFPKNKFEVIVVDNNSTIDIKKIVKKYNFKYLLEKKKGSYAARNKGTKKAKGSIFAFTDSDCIPDKNWIRNGVKELKKYDYIAGHIELFYKKNTLNITELFEKITAFNQKIYIEHYNFGVTANLFVKKNVFDKVGLFNYNLISGGDLEFGKRVDKEGFKLNYSNNVLVRHPAINTLKKLFNKHKRIIKGIHDINLNQNLKSFLIDLKDDWPQLDDFNSIFKDKRLGTLIKKLKVFYVMLLVKFARISERIKLKLGSKSRRI